MTGWLTNADIAGEIPARYYNVASRRYHEHANGTHASLCQTAMRSSLLWSALDAIRNEPGPFIDRTLWDQVAANSRRRLERSRRVVGMKGVPGRRGLGLGHANHHFGSLDAEAVILHEWLSDDCNCFLTPGGLAKAS